MNTITPHIDTSIQNMRVPHMLLDSVGGSVGGSVGQVGGVSAVTSCTMWTVDAIKSKYTVINYSPIIRLELRFGWPNVARHLKTVVPVVGGASHSFKSPLSLSALGGIIHWRSSINKIHHETNSRSCKTESAMEGAFQDYFLWVPLLRLRQALRLFGHTLLHDGGRWTHYKAK
jgi:hypothetical protein